MNTIERLLDVIDLMEENKGPNGCVLSTPKYLYALVNLNIILDELKKEEKDNDNGN
tara:strand:- start:112 stop:279 length:168 start_codon:yes stop_codon:yes gene_type:complete